MDHAVEAPLFAHNAESVYEQQTAAGFTDQLSTFVKKGYIAGPFDRPPLPNFRVNQIMGVRQAEKVRPVMNLSHPKHDSFNDAIPKSAFPKVTLFISKRNAQRAYQPGRAPNASRRALSATTRRPQQQY